MHLQAQIFRQDKNSNTGYSIANEIVVLKAIYPSFDGQSALFVIETSDGGCFYDVRRKFTNSRGSFIQTEIDNLERFDITKNEARIGSEWTTAYMQASTYTFDLQLGEMFSNSN